MMGVEVLMEGGPDVTTKMTVLQIYLDNNDKKMRHEKRAFICKNCAPSFSIQYRFVFRFRVNASQL